MQPDDVYGSYPSGESAQAGWTGTLTGERQFGEYVSTVGDTVSSRVGQIAEFLVDRPLLVGSVVVGAAGAFAGSRVARMIAMRRRKTASRRAMETLSVAMAVIGSMATRESTRRAMNRLTDAGKGIAAPAQGVVGSVTGRLPVAGKDRAGQPGMISRIGYGISLVPLALALIRNPLVRETGFRFLARRARGR